MNARSLGNSLPAFARARTRSRILFGAALAVLALSGCSSPCHDYCSTFVDKAEQCGLGGPSGSSTVDQCSDQVSDELSHDQCTEANDVIESQSCDQFKQIVCAQSNAAEIYNCSAPSGGSGAGKDGG